MPRPARGVLDDLLLQLADEVDSTVHIAHGIDANTLRHSRRTAVDHRRLVDRRWGRTLEETFEQGILNSKLKIGRSSHAAS